MMNDTACRYFFRRDLTIVYRVDASGSVAMRAPWCAEWMWSSMMADELDGAAEAITEVEGNRVHAKPVLAA